MNDEIKKEENILSDNFKKNLKNLWDGIIKIIKKFWNWLSDIGIKKIIGIIIFSIASVGAFVEFLAYVFVVTDKNKFAEIINYFYDFNIFEYLSVENFYILVGGGFLMDMAGYMVIILLGIWLWKSKNYFKVKNFGWILVGIFALGLGVFGYGLYNAMPKIMIPLEKICEKKHYHIEKNHHIEKNNYLDRDKNNYRKLQEEGFKKIRIDFNNSFEEREAYHNDFNRSFFEYVERGF